jgi:hypothetical protein
LNGGKLLDHWTEFAFGGETGPQPRTDWPTVTSQLVLSGRDGQEGLPREEGRQARKCVKAATKHRRHHKP